MTTQKNAAQVAVAAEPCLNLALADVISGARSKVKEATAVVSHVIHELKSDAACGLLYLLDWLDTRFEHFKAGGEAEFEELSANTCAVVAVLSQLNESFDNQMLYAAHTVLGVAKSLLDEAIEKGGANGS